MSAIGDQIKKYRIEKDITQEKLGQLIGVTTQAVSRWERGGMPDAEILPHLADALGVSIDALFGREEQSFEMTIARQLCQMPREEAYRYAFNICWAIEIGLVGDISIMDDIVNKFVDKSITSMDKKKDYFAKIVHDNGIANARISPGFQNFFLMVEHYGSLKEHISDPEKLRRVFEIFADEKILRIIFYIYSRPNIPISASLIAKSTGLSLNEVDNCMEILCSNDIAIHKIVATVDGDMNAYIIRPESYAIPLLCFADEIAGKYSHPFWGNFDRSKPLI